LIKKLEDLGIGRPSTYASVMKTIDRRGYVWKKGKSLVPAFRAFAVVNLLQHYFADLVDYQFTAAMEDELDEIAKGNQDLEPWLQKFYFGDPSATTELAKLGLEHMTHEPHEFDFAAINSIPLGIAEDGVAISVRSGRYGPYLVHGDDRVSIPEATEPDSLSVARALELLSAPSNDRELGVDEETGLPIFLKAGRYGPYVQVGAMTDPKEKPKTASLLTTMSPETLTLADAKRLLSLPRVVGEHPEGEPIIAQNGRYGPYLTWGKETRSLEDEEQIFSIDLTGALALLAQPKQRGRRAAAGPLKELARTRSRSETSSCAPVASVSTSPTARSTRRFVSATPPRPSPSIAPASYSPNGATPNRRVVPAKRSRRQRRSPRRRRPRNHLRKRRPEPPSGRR